LYKNVKKSQALFSQQVPIIRQDKYYLKVNNFNFITNYYFI